MGQGPGDENPDRYGGRFRITSIMEALAEASGDLEALVPGCDAAKFLRQHEDFRWRLGSVAADRAVTLYDRATGKLTRAADLPLSTGEDNAQDCIS